MELKDTAKRVNLLQVGDRVCVTGYGPFRGLRGIIRTVDSIAADLEEPFCFYLIVLERAHVQEPIWFEYHEVELLVPASDASRRSS